VADSNARAFLGKARKALTFHLGDRWSAAWLPTGFPHQSTAVPATAAERQELLARLKDFFTAHPEMELPNPPQNVTTAQADALFQALSKARNDVAEKQNELGGKKAARDAAEAALRARLAHGIEELGQLLGPDDPRWHALGLNLPSDPETPEQVTGLVATATTPGTLFVDWEDARRAGHYRVLIQVVGADADFRQADRRDESDATLTGLPSGATVKVKVTAANDASEGPASEVIEAVVK
jgi:hypothetical protein